MLNNVIEFADFQRAASPSIVLPDSGATIISMPTAKERNLAHMLEAKRIYEAAETLWSLDRGTRPITMMLELTASEHAGRYREKAATWLWRNCGVNVLNDNDEPVSLALKAFLAQ